MASNKSHRNGTLQTGTIRRIEDCGSIVIVGIVTPCGWIAPAFFGQGQFQHLLECEQCDASQLIGRAATLDGDVLRLDD